MTEFNGNDIIIRGKLITEHLVTQGINENRLQEQLKKNHIESITEVIYAEIQIDGSLYIETK